MWTRLLFRRTWSLLVCFSCHITGIYKHHVLNVQSIWLYTSIGSAPLTWVSSRGNVFGVVLVSWSMVTLWQFDMAMVNHHLQIGKMIYKWPFSIAIAMLNSQRIASVSNVLFQSHGLHDPRLFAMVCNLAVAVGLCWTDCQRFLSSITQTSKFTRLKETHSQWANMKMRYQECHLSLIKLDHSDEQYENGPREQTPR